MTNIRLLVVEDQTLLLSALCALLGLEADLEIVGSAGNGEEALALLQAASVDIVLTDIEMPKMDGITLAQRIKDDHTTCRTIILTTFARAGYLQRALKAGATGYLLKDQKAEHLAAVIRRVHRGETVVAAELTKSYWGELDPLSERERQVLRHIESGASTAEIATGIHLSEGTIRNYVSEAMSKLDARNRVDAARIARQKGFL
jgi:two-component system response regulator DesR